MWVSAAESLGFCLAWPNKVELGDCVGSWVSGVWGIVPGVGFCVDECGRLCLDRLMLMSLGVCVWAWVSAEESGGLCLGLL